MSKTARDYLTNKKRTGERPSEVTGAQFGDLRAQTFANVIEEASRPGAADKRLLPPTGPNPAPGRLGGTTGGLRPPTWTFGGLQPSCYETYSDVKPTVRKPVIKSTILEGQSLDLRKDGFLCKKLTLEKTCTNLNKIKFGQIAPYFGDRKLCVVEWFFNGFGSASPARPPPKK